jgi:MIP family channel proteins
MGNEESKAAGRFGLYGSSLGANMLRSAVAELIGTYLLVLAGTSVATAAALGRPTGGGPADALTVALAFGLALAALASALGHVSGAHFNPAVTLGLAATGKFPGRYVPSYLAAQFVGAILAGLTVWMMFGGAGRDVGGLGAPGPAAGVGDLRAFAVEATITFLLVLVVISVATDARAPAQGAAPAVGFALATAVLIGGPITGGAVNPARALGPMIVAGRFGAAWVYLVAPVVGAVLAGVLYDRFVKEGHKPKGDEGDDPPA